MHVCLSGAERHSETQKGREGGSERQETGIRRETESRRDRPQADEKGT